MSLPPHLADQLKAATTEVADAMLAIALTRPSMLVRGARSEVELGDAFLHELVARYVAEVEAGVAVCCVHIATVQMQPTFANAWDHPFISMCAECMSVRGPLPPELDDVCDVCGAHCETNKCFTSQLQIGPLLILLGRCQSCLPANHPYKET